MLFTRTFRYVDSRLCQMASTTLRSRRLPVLLTLALVAFAFIGPALGYASSHDPVIKRVEVDETTNRMKIIGVNFGSDDVTVTLAGSELHVISSNPTEILVYLPAGITPGTYLLKVSIGNRNPKEDTFNVAVGAQGPQGEPGPQGAQGPRGATGPRGQQGDIGPVGPRGPQGNAGATGSQGPRGAKGTTGATGAQGPIGNSGPAGPQGPAGANGVAGAPGTKGMNYRDVYDPAASYAVDDVVSHGGSSFIAKTVNTGVEPAIGSNWGLVATKGDTGPAGADGASGPIGPAGPEGPRGPEGSPGPGLTSFDSLEGLTCLGGTGRISLVYATNGDAALRCVFNRPPSGFPSLNINDITQPESQVLTFTVVLSAPSVQTVIVQFATEDGSAIAGADYVGVSGELTFLPGELSKVISVVALRDVAPESDETFRINLTNAVNANIGDAQGLGTIQNLEPARIAISSATCDEGDPCEFTVTRAGDISSTVTVNYRTQPGTAGASEYAHTQGTLTFLPGETTLLISVHTFGDGDLFDVNETFTVVLSNPSIGAFIIATVGTGTIRP